MFDKPFDQIEKSDIDQLVSDGVRESRKIEYKEQLPGRGREEKREFLEDLSAFANASGGYLLYGIEEERDASGKSTGLPIDAPGLELSNSDEEILYRENIVRDGIEPKIRIHIKPVEGFSNGPVLLIQIEQSWNKPHMLSSFRTRFFSRNSAGKQPLDITEIRAAFVASESLAERIQRFRDERLVKITADETPYPLPQGARLVLHLIPLSSFSRDSQHYDVAQVASELADLAQPIYESSGNRRFNFDGIVTGSSERDKEFGGYVQVFRAGMIEAVDARLLRRGPKNDFPILDIELVLMASLKKYLKLLSRMDVLPPVLLLLSFLGVKGYQITLRGSFPYIRTPTPIERDSLILPDVLIEDLSQEPARLLRPLFDVIWQSAGYQACPNYDDDGNYELRVSYE